MERGIIRWFGMVTIFWLTIGLQTAIGAEVKIGALFPFSGPMALLGEETFRGAEVARDLVNEKGGVWGQKVVYVKADAPDATAAVSEADRLITVEQVKVILGSYSSSLAYAASEVAERNRVIYWEQGGISDPITERGFKYLFRTLPRASQFGSLAAEYAANVVAPRLKIDPKKMTVGIIFEDTLYGTTVGSYAQQRAKELGLKVVVAETYSQK
ncbi:MAG: ABC transporter substrate-binding protein, partial [candidate division NC10 bacterium]|nr:ABC transporter substrate-binding protein [candidate division NC10 bacterium]